MKEKNTMKKLWSIAGTITIIAPLYVHESIKRHISDELSSIAENIREYGEIAFYWEEEKSPNYLGIEVCITNAKKDKLLFSARKRFMENKKFLPNWEESLISFLKNVYNNCIRDRRNEL